MRLLSLDYDPVFDDATRAMFAGDISVFDYDAVIWDPAGSMEDYVLWSETYRGFHALTEAQSVRIKADAKRRRTEFSEFIDSGRTLVVVTRPHQSCYVDSGQRSYSGTGRNRVTTRHLEAFDLLTSLPITGCGFSRARGDRIDFRGDGPIVALLKKYSGFLSYNAVISNPPGSPLAYVTGTDRIVSSIMANKSGGHLILLPVPNFQVEHVPSDDEPGESDADEHSWVGESVHFQSDLLEAIQQLSDTKSMSRPAWIERYATREQQRLRSDIVQQQGFIENARARLSELQLAKETTEARDQLFLGSGRALELEVKKVLEILGGVVTDPKPGRDDWRVSFPEGDAVVEVKGVGKSAAEKHAAQLEKWVAATLEETSKPFKGILIVNTWRHLPLADRSEEDFPPQMIPYSEARKHCLVTGLQLFCILADVEENVARAEHWRKALLETSGRIQGCSDWRSVIQETTRKSDS